MKRPQRRTECKHCGAHGAWLPNDEGIGMTFVNVPGYDKHICLKTKKSPLETFVAKKAAVEAQPQVVKDTIKAALGTGEVVIQPDGVSFIRPDNVPNRTENKFVEKQVEKPKVSYNDNLNAVHDKLDLILDILEILIRNKHE